MPRATVEAFDPTKGFGTLRLESGEVLPFDASVSNKREIRVGEEAEVTIGTGYTGQPKAKLLLFGLESDRASAFGEGVQQLQQFGLLVEWSLAEARAAAKEVLGEVPSKLTRHSAGGLLQHYYGEGLGERGRREGVLLADGHDASTAAQDLLAISGEASLPAADLSRGLEPLLAALNRALEGRQPAHRCFSLDFDGDFYALVFRPARLAPALRASPLLKLL